jgi:hypothetical protein
LKIPWKKTCGKTTTDVVVAAAEHKRMEEMGSG